MLRRLWRQDDGSTVLELAVVLPGLLLFFMVFIEVLMVLWVGAAMESALRSASRFGLTGWSPDGMDRKAAIMAIVSSRTMGLVTSANATIKTLVYADFAQIGTPEPFGDSYPYNHRYDPGESFIDVNGDGVYSADMGRAGEGGPGEVVLYTIEYRSPFLTPLQSWIGGTGFTALKASAVVRNEPWGN